ncbi:MAG TPA: tetratricopeptide repeat protein [Pyrinomonadaceae bacterium]|nr:tetratricopeptide repeat protein [Pyrinomonadaceae bacterium]
MSDSTLTTTDPFDATALDEATELRALSQALQLAEGFKLIFVRCNQPQQRRKLVADLRAELPEFKVQEIQFNEPVTHLLDELRSRIAEPAPDAVFVYGLEYSLPAAADADSAPLVANLNASRNSFPQNISCPLVLWIPEYVLNAIVRGAPDFFSIRSGVYFFAAAPGDTTEIASTLTAGEEWAIESLSFKEKQERIDAIKSLLADYESLPDSQRSYKTETRLHQRLGNLFLVIGNYSLARKHYEKVLMLARQLRNRNGEGFALTGLGHMYFFQGRLAEAAEMYQQALAIARDIKGRSNEGKLLMNLGNVYDKQGHLDDAEKFYREALEISREASDRATEARVLGNLGITYLEQERLSEAEEFYQQCLRVSGEVGDLAIQATVLNDLAGIYEQQGRWSQAEKYCQDSLAIMRKIGDLVGEGRTLRNLSYLLAERGDLIKAMEFAQEAVEILKTTGNQQEFAEVQELLTALQQEVNKNSSNA